MVSQGILIWIAVGVFFAGVGIGYAVLQSTTPTMPMMMNQQQMQQMMNDPQQMNQWMNTMMNDPQVIQQMHDSMMNNPQHMNQMMGLMMNTIMNDPDMQQQMMNMMMQNPDMMNSMMMQNPDMMNSMMNNQQMMDMMNSGMMGDMMNNQDMMNMMVNNMMMDSGMMERGNMAMGFDQTKIMHFFDETPTGGEVGIIALDKNDVKTISKIRSHVEDIQYEFSQGNFSKPFFIHAQVVPGTEIMNENKDLIQYSTQQIEGGAILVLTTNDSETLDAIAQFLEFQSSQHMGH